MPLNIGNDKVLCETRPCQGPNGLLSSLVVTQREATDDYLAAMMANFIELIWVFKFNEVELSLEFNYAPLMT